MAQTLTLANLKKAMEQNNSTLKEWINTQLANMSTFNIVWVEKLPTEDISTSTIYMLKNTESTDENNIYDEYVYNETSGWEVIGSLNTGSVDLSEYYNKTETYSKEEIDNLLTNFKSITISSAENNAVVENEDGLFVEDKTSEIEAVSTKVNEIKKYQKYLNTDMDYFKAEADNVLMDTPVTGNGMLANPILMLASKGLSTNMKYDVNSGYLTLKAGKRYYYSLEVQVYLTSAVGTQIGYTLLKQDGTNIHSTLGFKRWLGNQKMDDYGVFGIVEPQIDVQIIPAIVYITGGTIERYWFNLVVYEIGQQTVIDPVEHINTTQGIEDTPVGHIISHMGNNAPKHYLICDGTEYNISEYPYLAQHFIDEFGSANYFGGNGETTFAVPDLRGEFLRGTGTALRNMGAGAAVGTHQDPTWHGHFATSGSGKLQHYLGTSAPASSELNYDKHNSQGTALTGYQITGTSFSSGTYYSRYTARPTNTAVLYCIKYEPTYFMVNKNTNYLMPNLYSEEERVVGCWVNGKPLYQKTIETTGASVYDLTDLSIDIIWIYDGYVLYESALYPLNWRNSANAGWFAYTNGNTFSFIHNGYTPAIAYATIRYTKTTDEENSFTNDMITDFTVQSGTTEEYSEEDVTNAINKLW